MSILTIILNPKGHPKTVILDSPSITTLINKPTTPLVLKSASVKHKKSNVFSPILEVLDKNSKMFVDAIEHTISIGSSKQNSLCTQIHVGQNGQLISWYQTIQNSSST